MPQISSNPHAMWSRDGLFIRLSRRRKADLASIAATLGPNATPTDVIDHAVALAKMNGGSQSVAVEDRLEDIIDAIDMLSMERRADFDKHEAMLTETRDAVVHLLQVIEHSAGPMGNADVAADIRPAAPMFSDWLGRELERRGLQVGKPVTIHAKWLAGTRVGERFVSMDFSVELRGADAMKGPPSLAITRIDMLDVGGPMDKADKSLPFYFLCSPDRRGWKVAIHRCERDGGMGPLIDARLV